MSDEGTGNVLASAYGLALGLALGAVLWSAAPTLREAAVSACWMGAIEVGAGSGARCFPEAQHARPDQPVTLASLARP